MACVPGLSIRKSAFKLECNPDCAIHHGGRFPALKCALILIDDDKWMHEEHLCTSNICKDKLPNKTKNGLPRRTQHYGFEYDYKNRGNPLSKTKSLNSNIAVQMFADILAPNFPDEEAPNQCIINEYRVEKGKIGQGISAHTDHRCFGEVIMTISLIGSCSMEIISPDNKIIQYRLEPGDIVLLEGEARYKYKHAIKNMKYADVDPSDPRRISLTYRTV